jgi:very-short-patch-repair endonuclease
MPNSFVSSECFFPKKDRRGVEFVTEHAIGVFCVDVYIPREKLVLFVDGCYWHACPIHFPHAKKLRPGPDAARIPYLTKGGYKVGILWEHEIKENVPLYLDQLLTQLQCTLTSSEVMKSDSEAGLEI